MQAYHFTEVESQDPEGLSGVHMRWAIAQNVQAPNFALRVIDIDPNSATEHHTHDWEHEVIVLEGEGKVLGEDGPAKLSAGVCVYMPPNEKHQFINTGESVLRIVCVIPNPA